MLMANLYGSHLPVSQKMQKLLLNHLIPAQQKEWQKKLTPLLAQNNFKKNQL
jgi:hypothetical protein